MQRIKNVSPLGELEVVDLHNRVVKFGEVVEVPDALADALLAQAEHFEAVEDDEPTPAKK